MKISQYKGYTIIQQPSHRKGGYGGVYVEKEGRSVHVAYKVSEARRWVDSVLREAQRVKNPIRRRGPPKGRIPPQLRRYLFKKGHR